MEGSGKRSLAYVTAAILIAGVLVSTTLILVPLSRPPTTITETSVSTSTETLTSTSGVSTTTVTTTIPSVVNINPYCPVSKTYGYSSGTLVAGTSSPAIICVQVYWFNSTYSMTLTNLTSLLQIEGPANGASNFTVTAYLPGCLSACQINLGGAPNIGEGTILALAITAKPGASGTYQLYLQQFQLGPQGPWKDCANGDLVAGSGQPNYVPPNETCLPITIIAGTNSTQFSIPGVSYTVPGGVFLYRIIGLTNSTQ